jgi:hypothetical protein
MKVHKKNTISFLLLMLFALCVQWGNAQDIKVKVFIDSSSIKIGDQIKLHYELEQPENAKFQMPVFPDNIAGVVEILKVIPPDTIRENKLLKIRHDFLITCFDSGSYHIPSIAIPYSIGNKKDTLRTDSLSLAVMNLPTDTITQVLDIKPPMKAPINFAEAWPYLLGFLVFALLMAALWFYLTKRKKGGLFFAPKKQEPPHIIALRELDSLRTQKLWQNNKIKQYYVDLSDIIRKYLQHRYEIQALEMTSDEIIDSFKYNNLIDLESKDLLKNLFTLSDLVKFAKAQPLPDENEVSLLNAYQFVNNTKVAETELSDTSNQELNKNQVLNK